jgi:uncharacterized membrane protein
MNTEVGNSAFGRLSKNALNILYLSIATFIIFKVIAIASIPVLGHDDGITLLSISGEQGAYARLSDKNILNKWLPADIFTGFTSASGELNFLRIQNDLNNYDIHPPLYFWLLATWSRVFPGMVDSYFILNVVFSLLSIFAFYKTLRLKFSSDLSAMMTISFIFLPVLITSRIYIRQYELNMLASSCLLFSTSYLIAMPHIVRRDLIAAIGIITSILLGLMSHAQFALAVSAILSAMIFVRCAKSKLATAFLASAAACFLFLLLNSGFITAFLRHRNQLQEAGFGEFLGRIKNIVLIRSVDIFPMPGLAAFILLAVLVLYGFRKGMANNQTKIYFNTLERYWITSGASVFVIYTFYYAAMQGPVHAYGGRYFLPIAPWLAVSALSLCVGISKKYALPSVTLISTYLFISASHEYIATVPNRLSDRWAIRSAMSEASSIFIGNSARGIASPIFPLISEKSKVFLSNSSLGEEGLKAAYDNLKEGDLIYVRAGYGVSAMEAAHQLSFLREDFQLVELPFNGMYILQ